MRGSVRKTVFVTSAAVICCSAAAEVGTPEKVSLDQQWRAQAGVTTISLDRDALAAAGLAIVDPEINTVVLPETLGWQVAIKRQSTLTFSVNGDSVRTMQEGALAHGGSLTMQGPAGAYRINDPVIAPGNADKAINAVWVVSSTSGEPALLLSRVKAGFDPATAVLTLRSDEVRLTPMAAAALGNPDLVNRVLGDAIVRTAAKWVGGARPDLGSVNTPPASSRSGGLRADGCEMTFCQLYGHYMPSGAREGDIVGLSVATTSWNLGNEDCIWWNIPAEEHPFIVMEMYRLEADENNQYTKFEMIGMSHIKHGFYALGSHQCGGPACTFEPGHSAGDWLGQNCTDTYSASLNAVQSGMGPKYEVNPWTGYWLYAGSHMQSSHTHDNIQHRLQVKDEDLDQSVHGNAEYFSESFYCMLDDIDAMTSVAWKPVTITGGSPGGFWTFGMSSSSVYPNIGWALDAWEGATQSLLSQDNPVIEFVSPDGRCIWASKPTDLGNGLWHYEYALLNIDMDRQVGSVSIPLPPGAYVTNIEFHAPHHHDEPFNTKDADAVPIDNAPWEAVVASDSITWSTTTNPVRWAMMYNFRFDSNVPAERYDHTFGLFRPGTPTHLQASGWSPSLSWVGCPGDTDGDGNVGVTDFLNILAAWGPCAGCPEDLNFDGNVDVQDFLALLSAWGPCPE
jgi:hypothetical protein